MRHETNVTDVGRSLAVRSSLAGLTGVFGRPAARVLAALAATGGDSKDRGRAASRRGPRRPSPTSCRPSAAPPGTRGSRAASPPARRVCATVNAAAYGNGAAGCHGGHPGRHRRLPGRAGRAALGRRLPRQRRPTRSRSTRASCCAAPGHRRRRLTQDERRRANPLILIGERWLEEAGSVDLTADAPKGATSVQVASTAGFSVGQLVVLDEIDRRLLRLLGHRPGRRAGRAGPRLVHPLRPPRRADARDRLHQRQHRLLHHAPAHRLRHRAHGAAHPLHDPLRREVRGGGGPLRPRRPGRQHHRCASPCTPG